MIILHAGTYEGSFRLWGEKPVEAAPASAPRRGRKPKAPKLRSLPFDAGAEGLTAALQEALPELARRCGKAESTVAWLPTVRESPLPSSPLIAEPPAAEEEPVLAPWSVTALPLPAEQALELLYAALDRETLAPGVVVGTTLRFWATALRFGAALVVREQFLPGVEHTGDAWRSRWQLTLLGADGQRLNQLARSMPPACRALGAADAAPQVAAAAVLHDFLATMVDVLVRDAAAPAAPPHKRAGKARPAFESVHDEWLHALRTADAELPAAEAGKLAEQVSAWQRPLALLSAAPFRLCFRLEEPTDKAVIKKVPHAEPAWIVRYLLQAQDDPSLLVPVPDALTARGGEAAVLQRDGFQPREYVLSALGQAASLCPEVEVSLKSPVPAAFATDAAGAYRFLTETAWALEQAGYGVLLPAWWTRKGSRQRLSVSAQIKRSKLQSTGGLSLEDLVKFDWKVALGEHALTLRELEALAKLKAPLVQVRGQWVQVSPEELQAAIDFLKARGGGEATLRELLKMELGAAPAPGGLAFGGVQGNGPVGRFLDQLQGKAEFIELPPPDGFQGSLRPYQVRGYSWLAFLHRWGLGACLADDMGLGKTVQALTLLQRNWQGDGRRPTLLICPMSVVGNWKKEAERFTPGLPVLVHHGQKRARDAAFVETAEQHALVISSYALLHRDQELLRKVRWGGVILDEAQNIKNPETKQAQAARALPADYRIALTGTPVENHVGDLWSIWQFLNPGFLGTQAEFRRRFFVPIQLQRDPEAAEQLKRLTGPFLLRRLKTDRAIIADLPDKLEMKVFCNLTKEQGSLYAAVVEDLDRGLGDAEGIQRKGLILGALSKLKQVCNHPAQFLKDGSPIPGRSGKLARLTEMLEEALEAGDRALVFTQFTEMGELIQRHLQETFGREVLFLHGGVGQKQRDRMVARFQEADGPPIFLLSLKAGGTGLNLTAANHVFHFDRWWNPAVENQATDRAFRIGQTRNVQVHKFLCVGTLEEKIDQMIERKQEVAAQVVGTDEAWLTELSNDELRDLFALRQEALGE
jgi:SNF2 family DNA or RNA helicase